MALIYGSPGEEPGDKLVFETLGALRDEWIVYAQPKLVCGREERNPDYVVVHRDVGVVVLEVKDWVRILEWSSKDATIYRTASAKEVVEPSPVDQARKAALHLVNILKQDESLCSYSGKLDFPYRFAGVLPHQPMSVITQLEKAWGSGSVIGRDDLRSDLIEDRLRKIYAPVHMPMEERHVRAVCAAIDPRMKIVDVSTRTFKGVYDREQERLAKEAFKAAEISEAKAPEPGQAEMLLEPDLGLRMKTLEAELPASAVAIKTAENVRLVRGYAGTGKTDVLILRARYLAEQNPHLAILVTTFNDPLYAERLKPELRDLSGCVDVIKFDSLCADVFGRRHGRWVDPQDTRGLVRSLADRDPEIAALGADFLAEEFIWMKETGRVDRSSYVTGAREGRGGSTHGRLSAEDKEKVFEAFEKYERELRELPAHDWVDLHTKVLAYLEGGACVGKQYDAILIDEGQHFAPNWMAILRHFLKEDGSLFICDDPSQSVYRSYSWRQKGVDVVGRTRWLRVPYRSTRQIFAAANAVVAGNPLASKMLAESGESPAPDLGHPDMRDGPRPVVMGFPTAAAERELIAKEAHRLVSEEGVLPHEIGILHEHGYVLDRYRSVVPQGTKLFEIRRQTGLEYRAVFIPQVQAMDERTVGLSLEEDRARRCIKFYSAMTRARTWLYMGYEGKWPRLLEPVLPYCTVEDEPDQAMGAFGDRA